MTTATTKPKKSLTALAGKINRAVEQSESAMRSSIRYAMTAGRLLLKAKAQVGHGAWGAWLAAHCKCSERSAQAYMRLAREMPRLDPAKAQRVADLSYRQMLQLLAQPTAGHDANVHVANHSGEEEWYTPSEFLNAGRAVLGAFDLDPASSHAAQRSVKASRYYTREDDGLRQDWSGRLWLNPPYAAGLVDQFIAKLVMHYAAGDVPAAIALTNNATETRWFRKVASVASAICFPTGRVAFIDPTGEPSGSPLQGQAILYLGTDRDRFLNEYSSFGFCVAVTGAT